MRAAPIALGRWPRVAVLATRAATGKGGADVQPMQQCDLPRMAFVNETELLLDPGADVARRATRRTIPFRRRSH